MEIHYFSCYGEDTDQSEVWEWERAVAREYGGLTILKGRGLERRRVEVYAEPDTVAYIVVTGDRNMDKVRDYKEWLEQALGERVICSVISSELVG